MTNDIALWSTISRHIPRKTWVSIVEIYAIVQHRTDLDADDLGRPHLGSRTPQWKFNVRRILHSKHRDGTLMRRTTPTVQPG